MALANGDPGEAWDTWLRVITDAKYWKKDGTLHNNAFGGKAINPPTADRPWSHELSGRLLSFVESLEKDCVEFCGERFAGVMYQKVENLRALTKEGNPTDVRYTPRAGDNAHADFVAFGVEDKKRLMDWLQDFIQHVHPDKLAAIEALRRVDD